jgi:hypothetical protein
VLMLVGDHAMLLHCCMWSSLSFARDGCGDTELMRCSFFEKRGHTTATHPRHGYGFCTGLNLPTRTHGLTR